MKLLFGTALVGDKFQKKIDALFSSIPNIVGIVGDILIGGFDEFGKDHNKMLEKVLQISRQVDLKLNKDKCLFRCTGLSFFYEII